MLLVNVDALDALDLDLVAGRTLFVGASLNADEQKLAQTFIDAAGHELRARIVGALEAQRTPTPEPKTEEQGEEP